MNFHTPGEGDDLRADVNSVELPAEPPAEVAAQQRAHLRRIMIGFVVVVVLLPFAGLGGAWSWLLLPVLVFAGFALREAIRLRRSVSRHGAARGR
ncbi:MAG: hypothetical protein JWL76_2302 [Thermoleophilia bacterium]|nr:hypothetical protein [Thermoleophilia bacterium]